MSTKNTNITLFVFIVVATGLGIFLYPSLPEQIASHWDSAGMVNGYMSKFWGIFLLPIIMLGIFGLYYIIPKVDPLKRNIESFRKYYNAFWIFLFAFFLYIFILMMAWNLGYRFNFSFAIIPAIAVLFYILGMILEKSKRNWFVGIRTPWTLSSDVVWEKTHKLGGKLFKIAALISLLALISPKDSYFVIFLVIPIVAVSLITIVYSYLEYKKLS